MHGENAYSCEACAKHATEAKQATRVAADDAVDAGADADADAVHAVEASSQAVDEQEEEAEEAEEVVAEAVVVEEAAVVVVAEEEEREEPAQQPAVKILQLVRPPAVLTVHLKRFAVAGRSTKKLDSAVTSPSVPPLTFLYLPARTLTLPSHPCAWPQVPFALEL